MDQENLQAAIAAKDFTYVSAHYFDDGRLRFDRFVVLTPSKPLARRAAEKAFFARHGEMEVVAKLDHSTKAGVAFDLYPRNYVSAVKRTSPRDIYAVTDTGSLNVETVAS